MRVPTLAASLSLALLPFVHARSGPQQQPLEVYLYPAPESSLKPHSHPPTLSYNQAKAVLNHHLKQGHSDIDEIPEDESLWAHLMGLWDGAEQETKGRVVVVDGGVDAQEVLPASLPSQPAFYMKDDVPSHSLIAPYIKEARSLLAHVVESFPALAKPFTDILDFANTKGTELFAQELTCLTALADSLPWTGHSSNQPWESVTITGLRDTPRKSEIWETGRKTVEAGLESMTAPNSPPLLLIIRPSSNKRIISRAAPITLAATSKPTLADSCYTSNETCSDATACNGRGVCTLKSQSGDSECWGCKCRNGYAGVECQKDDYSTSFIILIFSTVLLLSLAGGSIALLYTVGESKLPSTLTLAVGGVMKRD